MFNIFFYNYLFIYGYQLLYLMFFKIPLFNYFVYTLRFCFVTFYRELNVWNLIVFTKRFYDYLIGSIYYSYIFFNFRFINKKSILWLLNFNINFYIFKYIGFAWNRILRIDFPEKIDMLTSLYIYVLSIDIIYDSYYTLTDRLFYTKGNFELFIIYDNTEVNIVVVDLLLILANLLFLLNTEFFFNIN